MIEQVMSQRGWSEQQAQSSLMMTWAYSCYYVVDDESFYAEAKRTGGQIPSLTPELEGQLFARPPVQEMPQRHQELVQGVFADISREQQQAVPGTRPGRLRRHFS